MIKKGKQVIPLLNYFIKKITFTMQSIESNKDRERKEQSQDILKDIQKIKIDNAITIHHLDMHLQDIQEKLEDVKLDPEIEKTWFTDQPTPWEINKKDFPDLAQDLDSVKAKEMLANRSISDLTSSELEELRINFYSFADQRIQELESNL
jgi:hypothetical protein